MKFLCLALPVSLLTVSSLPALAQEKQSPFDGAWQVHLACEDTVGKGGGIVKGYVFDFPAEVRVGELHGQRGEAGGSSSLALTGSISANGEAHFQADGYTGQPDYTVGHVRPSSPYSYTLRGHFGSQRGHAEREELRRCNADFVKLSSPPSPS